MSQDASTHQMLLNPSQDDQTSVASTEGYGSTEATPVIPVESYADRLMDDLFDDVERMLDGGIKTSVEPVRSTSPASESSKFANLVLPLSSLSPQAHLPEADDEPVDPQFTSLATLSEKGLATKAPGSSRSFDRWLVGIGCLSIVVSLAAWFISQRAQQPANIPSSTQVAANPNPEASTDNRFVEYMRRAIQAIEQKTQGESVVSPVNVPTATLPTVTVPGNAKPGTPNSSPSPAATANTPAGVQRVYVPVYQVPPRSLSAKLNPSSGVTVAPLPVPSQSAAATRSAAPPSVPGVARTLIGVMELGDRSAALIEINGIAQRYRVGESISSSGWALVEVSKDQAIVRRNGEVRSIFIGQSF